MALILKTRTRQIVQLGGSNMEGAVKSTGAKYIHYCVKVRCDRKVAERQNNVDILDRPEDMHLHFIDPVNTITSYNRRP